ncbi:MAG: hypothetical protein ACK5EN_18530, partial [Planctomyces sp.]
LHLTNSLYQMSRSPPSGDYLTRSREGEYAVPTTNHQPPTTNCQLKTQFLPARPLRLIRGAARSPEPWYPADFHELPAFLRQRPAIKTAQPISTAVPGLQICEHLPKTGGPG